MDRNDIIEQILEQLEDELNELSNPQLAALLDEYEQGGILANVIENLDLTEEEDEETDEDTDGLSVLDGDWEEENDEE